MKLLIYIPDDEIPKRQEIMSIDLHFIDGKVCECTYPFEEITNLSNEEIEKYLRNKITDVHRAMKMTRSEKAKCILKGKSKAFKHVLDLLEVENDQFKKKGY